MSVKGKQAKDGTEIPSRILHMAQRGISDNMTPTLSVSPFQTLGYNLSLLHWYIQEPVFSPHIIPLCGWDGPAPPWGRGGLFLLRLLMMVGYGAGLEN